jgi:hypothetical protein
MNPTTHGYSGGMGLLPPMQITPAHVTTSVPPDDLPAWDAAASYALDAEVLAPDTRAIYRSLAAANKGNPLTDATKWQPHGVENRMRMFEKSLGTCTEADELIELTLTPGCVVTDMQLLGVHAYDVQVTMADPDGKTLYDSGARRMLRPSGNSHWGYFFNPIEWDSKLFIGGLPAYVQARITVRLRNPGGRVRCAALLLGRSVWLGDTYWRPSIGYDDWSVKKRDPWGGWIVEPGAASERMKLQVLVRGTQYGRTREQVLQYRSTPVVWFGARGIDALTSYGYIQNFEQVLAAHGFSDVNMTIEGLES